MPVYPEVREQTAMLHQEREHPGRNRILPPEQNPAHPPEMGRTLLQGR
ncbi:MAG: hypothetical protein LIO96_13255 [Lachnospiraceae bacterium]|nr:hypothetical protein [Lachnospiraceae bacterium]